MQIVMERGLDSIARVFVAKFRNDDRYLGEFVDSLSGSPDRSVKWVAILSSQFGCPVGCRFCDAGDHFDGNMTGDEMLAQLDYLVKRHYPDNRIGTRKFKVQFARMGEPALNPEVIDAIVGISRTYDAPGLMPCISTVAPARCGDFFERLLTVKKRHFDASFQLQFSIHSTEEKTRDWLIPARKWSLEDIAAYGGRFTDGTGRRVTLNFALGPDIPVDAAVLKELFDPRLFVIKLTPVNPTDNANRQGLTNPLGPEYENGSHPLVTSLRNEGFDTVISIGMLEENGIGSNCGQVAALWKNRPIE